jgi:hypothetical protein
MQTKKGSSEVEKMLSGMRTNHDDPELFEKLNAKSLSLTFDHEGIPMMQKK